jgi:hypothetical protein
LERDNQQLRYRLKKTKYVGRTQSKRINALEEQVRVKELENIRHQVEMEKRLLEQSRMYSSRMGYSEGFKGVHSSLKRDEGIGYNSEANMNFTPKQSFRKEDQILDSTNQSLIHSIKKSSFQNIHPEKEESQSSNHIPNQISNPISNFTSHPISNQISHHPHNPYTFTSPPTFTTKSASPKSPSPKIPSLESSFSHPSYSNLPPLPPISIPSPKSSSSSSPSYSFHEPSKYHSPSYKAHHQLISQMLSPSGTVHRTYQSGKTELLQRDSVLKQKFPDGYEITYFPNGDISQLFSNGKSVQVIQGDVVTRHKGIVITKRRDGVVEKEYDGCREVFYTDGRIYCRYKDGREEWVMPDGTVRNTLDEDY